MDWLNKPWSNHIIRKHGAVEKNEVDLNVPNVLIGNNLTTQSRVCIVCSCVCATKDEARLYVYTHYFCKDAQEVNDRGCLVGAWRRLWNFHCSWRNTNLRNKNKTLHVREALLLLAPTYLWLLLCWGRSHHAICHRLTCSCYPRVFHICTQLGFLTFILKIITAPIPESVSENQMR